MTEDPVFWKWALKKYTIRLEEVSAALLVQATGGLPPWKGFIAFVMAVCRLLPVDLFCHRQQGLYGFSRAMGSGYWKEGQRWIWKHLWV
jgi:hypothetical protein